MDTQSPNSHPQQLEGVRLHRGSREIGEHRSSGLGIVGKTGAEWGGGWRDAGASHWIRDLSAFSERIPLGGAELLLRSSAKERCLEVWGAGGIGRGW